jgi:arginyl-tRNA synthetase
MFEEVEKQLLSLLKRSVATVCSASAAGHQVPQHILDAAILEIPKEKSFGDLSCSIAMKLSSFLRTKPQAIAAAIIGELERLARMEGATLIHHMEIKGAGFINIFLSDRVYQDLLRSVNERRRGSA